MIDLPVIEHRSQHGGGKWEVARKIGWEWNAEIMARLYEAERIKIRVTHDAHARLTRDEIIEVGRRVMRSRDIGDLPFHRYTGKKS